MAFSELGISYSQNLIIKISGSRNAATAKANRTVIPLL
jgi:hypothetical protein